MLQIEGQKRPTPDMGSVKTFHDFFPAIGQIAIAQEKTETAELEITTVVAGNCVAGEGARITRSGCVSNGLRKGDRAERRQATGNQKANKEYFLTSAVNWQHPDLRWGPAAQG